MNKQYCVISCPIDTYSGYGSRARDFVKAIYELKKDEWQIEILAQRWGSTPWRYINDHREEWGWLEPMINKTQQLRQQPDVWIQVTIPNEFQPIGKFNIGVTAGIETTLCDHTWLEGLNRMNLNLVSSNHAKEVFKGTSFEQKDQTGRVISKISLQKPVEVLFEGADLNKYFHKEKLDKTELVENLNQIKESFNYLFVGHWLSGEFGEDRKNVGLTIKAFLETFKDKKSKPGLVLKCSGGGASIMDRDQLLEKIDSIKKSVNSKDLPNVYLLHGELEDGDMNDLYNHEKIKAMISLTKGEGFGRPLLEFSLCKKPIIASNWSGHIDFLDKEFCSLISGEVKQIHPSAVIQNMLIPESGWFSVNIAEVKYFLKDIFENYNNYVDQAKRQSYKSKTQFSFDKMKELLSTNLEVVPKKVELKLPALKKIELPQLKKI
jgi:hypothetical protein